MEIHENLKLGNLVIDREVEIWKQVNTINGLEMFKDYYWVSSFGRVKSTNGNDKILRQATDSNGYLFVGLMTVDGKRKLMLVHRLVSFAFVGGYENGLVCNHLDEQKKNNHYNNLEWITQKENLDYGTRTKRQVEKLSMPVIGECIKTGEVIEFDSTRDAGRSGFHHGNVSEACRGRYASHCKHGGTNVYRGFRWSYVESV